MQTARKAVLMALVLGMGCSHAEPQTDRNPNLAGRVRANDAPNEKSAAAASTVPGEDGKADQGENTHSVYFVFDSAQIAAGDKAALLSVARQVKSRDSRLRVEGNCDERGTTEYNLALGDRRARAAVEYLVHLGVSPARIDHVSYGSERPKDDSHNEAAWAKNRRDDILLN
jgi:peptidoglycan-associated lipoprotein